MTSCSNTGRQGDSITWEEYKEDFQKNGWKDAKVVAPDTWGTYRRYETGMMPLKAYGDKNALEEFAKPGFGTPTRKMEIWNTLIETVYARGRRKTSCPTYKEPPLSPIADPDDEREVPVHRNDRPSYPGVLPLRASPAALVPRAVAGCRASRSTRRTPRAWASSRATGCGSRTTNGKIREVADLYHGIAPGAVNLEHQWWYPELKQPDQGFDAVRRATA